jgi:uncharacterized protein YndB with AHSA1/START domain
MIPDTTPDQHLGTIEKAGGRCVLRYERHLRHPVERVWAALTEPEQLATWLAAADELELVEGGRIALRWLNAPEEGEWDAYEIELDEEHNAEMVGRGTITRLDPPRLIEYETDAFGLMRWELRAAEGGCVLTFVNTVELPQRFWHQTLAGWHIHLDHLEEALAGRPVEWSTWTADHMDAWTRIRDRYAAAGD